MEAKNTPITGVLFLHGLMSSVLCHYLAMIIYDWFMSHMLCLYSCPVLCGYLFIEIDLYSHSNVAIASLAVV